jgi:hypothetical protein
MPWDQCGDLTGGGVAERRSMPGSGRESPATSWPRSSGSRPRIGGCGRMWKFSPRRQLSSRGNSTPKTVDRGLHRHSSPPASAPIPRVGVGSPQRGLCGRRKMTASLRRSGFPDIAACTVDRRMPSSVCRACAAARRSAPRFRPRMAGAPAICSIATSLPQRRTGSGLPTSSATRRSRTLVVVGGHRWTPVAAGVWKLEDGRSPRRGGGWWSSP